MTWIEVIPCGLITLGLGYLAVQSFIWSKRSFYRGMLDRRVEWGEHGDPNEPGYRLAERDERLGIQPADVQWIHNLWKPRNFVEKH